MKFQRVELHNHTNESDGMLTVEELMKYAANHDFGVIALTDHNIISGHNKAQEIIQENNLDISLIKGVEVTTVYGHILGIGLDQFFDFIDVNPYQPEKLFKAMRNYGAKAIGIAHPFCIGNPIMTGCRLYMDIEDFSEVDYIEIFNTVLGDSHFSNQFLGNYKALDFWEKKVLEGCDLAAVSGKDLHNIPVDEATMITYAIIEEKSDLTLSEQVIEAILKQATFVTKGPLVHCLMQDQVLTLKIDHSSNYYEWDRNYLDYQPILVLRDEYNKEFIFEFSFDRFEHHFEIPSNANRFTAKIYNMYVEEKNLLTAGILIRKEET